MKLTHWGHHIYEGVDFYIEPGFEVPEFCNMQLPPKTLRCPHEGLNFQNNKKWETLAYVYVDDWEELRKLLPENMNVDMDITFVSPWQILDRPYMLGNLTKTTNALPLFIFGVNLDLNYNRLFSMIKSTRCVRPIYVCGARDIPIPKEFKKLEIKDIN